MAAAAVGGDGFEGLTLRVVPSVLKSDGDTTQALPALLKPLLRVSARSVGVDKIQRFIHKRMLAQTEANVDASGVPPEDIEIIRDGTPLKATAVISGDPSAADGVIILHYRRHTREDVDDGSHMDVVNYPDVF